MTLLQRALAALLALALIALGGWYILHLRSALAASEAARQTAVQALKQTQATLAYREQQRRTSDRAAASARASLAEALKAKAEWADTQTPKEVQDALCAHIACAGADSVRSTADTRP